MATNRLPMCRSERIFRIVSVVVITGLAAFVALALSVYRQSFGKFELRRLSLPTRAFHLRGSQCCIRCCASRLLSQRGRSRRLVLCITFSCGNPEPNCFIMTPRSRVLNALNLVLKQGLTMKTVFCTGRCDVDANIGSLIRQSGVIADELSLSDEDDLDSMVAGSLASLASQFGEEANRCGDPALSACLRLQSADLWRAISDSGIELQDEQAM